MKMKRSLLVLCAIVMIGFLAFIPKNEDPIEKFVTALQRWTETNPQEKVYLHTDKPYYLVGDTIWFKAYVTVGGKNQLSALSGAVYVDLINEADSLAGTLKLPVISGMAKGNFILHDSTALEGNYRIRAYTQWMRNAGPEYFYDKVFSVGNSVANAVFARVEYQYATVNKKLVTTALITYTDETGKPYADKKVRYELKDNGIITNTGGGTTGSEGQLKIVVDSKPGLKQNSFLITRVALGGDVTVTKNFQIKSVATQSDVQFFPESGPLVNGVRTKVAFKAIGTNGLGLAVKGVVTDNQNNEVATFEAQHLGMGFFRMLPEAGKTYQAKVTYPDGSENTIKLPAAVDNGYVLAVYNNAESDTVLVRLMAPEAMYKAGNQKVGIIAQAGGTVFLANELTVSKATTTLIVPKKELNSGIVQFTLLSAAGETMNERIILVQNDDQMKVKLSSAKKEYAPREKVEINLDAADAEGKPLVGNFSVSVIDETAVPTDEVNETSIFSHLMLSADIKGYIEKPNYYFHNPTPETKANLDILMLTQGYRRFVWKDLIAAKPAELPFKSEGLATNVTGRLFNLGNKPLAGGKVTLMNNKLGLVIDTVTDANGRFRFSNLLITDGINFSLQGSNAKGGNKVEIKVDKVFSQEPTPNLNIGDLNTDFRQSLLASFENSKKQDQDLQKHGMLGRTQVLREVQITAAKRRKVVGYGLSIPDGHADQTIRPDKDGKFNNVLEFLTFRLTNVQFRMQDTGECGPVSVPFTRGEAMGIIFNGRKISPCEAMSFYEGDPADIIKVDVVRSNQALISMLGGVALVITSRNSGLRSTYEPSIASYSPKGFDNSKEFYSPKYGTANDPQVADLRSTIFWNPGLVSLNGKAKFDFYNSDNRGTYRVVVEGINADGLLGRQVYRFDVK